MANSPACMCHCMISSMNSPPFEFEEDLGLVLETMAKVDVMSGHVPPVLVVIRCPSKKLHLGFRGASVAALILWSEEMYKKHCSPPEMQSVAQGAGIEMLADGTIKGLTVIDSPTSFTIKADSFKILIPEEATLSPFTYEPTPVQIASSYGNMPHQVAPMQPEPYVSGVLIKLGDDCPMCGLHGSVHTLTGPKDEAGDPTFKHYCVSCGQSWWDYSIDQPA
jgi:hypothetical protein